MKTGPMNMLCIYKLNAGAEDKFRPLLKAHWPALNSVGLAGPEPVKIWRGQNRKGEVTYVETYQWKDADSPRIAHQRSLLTDWLAVTILPSASMTRMSITLSQLMP